jgi:hypothetical protein
MKAWITTYALSTGIKEMEGKNYSSKDYFYPDNYAGLFRWGADAFHTQEEAKIKAEAMRKKKIADLEKQLAKLKELTF